MCDSCVIRITEAHFPCGLSVGSERILPNFKDRVKGGSKSHKDLPPQACPGRAEGAQYRSCDEEGPHRRGSRRTRPVPVAHGGRRRRAGGRGPGRPRRPARAAPQPAGRARGRPPRRRRPALRLAGRGQARQRARGARDRPLRPRLPRRRRLHRRFQRLHAAARRRPRRGRGRRLRPDRPVDARRPSRDRDRAAERPRDAALGPSLRPRLRGDRRLLHLAGQGPARGGRLPGAGRRAAGDGQAAVRARPRAGRQGRRPRRGRPPRGDPRRRRGRPRPSGSRCCGFAPSGLPGPKGNIETFVWCSREGRSIDDLAARLGELEV